MDVPAGFFNITNFTASTFKVVNNSRLQNERNFVFVAKEVANHKGRKHTFDIYISTVIVNYLPKFVLSNFRITLNVR